MVFLLFLILTFIPILSFYIYHEGISWSARTLYFFQMFNHITPEDEEKYITEYYIDSYLYKVSQSTCDAYIESYAEKGECLGLGFGNPYTKTKISFNGKEEIYKVLLGAEKPTIKDLFFYKRNLENTKILLWILKKKLISYCKNRDAADKEILLIAKQALVTKDLLLKNINKEDVKGQVSLSETGGELSLCSKASSKEEP